MTVILHVIEGVFSLACLVVCGYDGLSVCLSVCLLPACLSVLVFVCLSVFLSVCLKSSARRTHLFRRHYWSNLEIAVLTKHWIV